MISGVAGIARNLPLDKRDRIAGKVSRQPDQAGEVECIGVIRLNIKQQPVQPIRFIQAPGLVMLHSHVQQLAAIPRDLGRRLL